jgi:FkbM family methyltransferase
MSKYYSQHGEDILLDEIFKDKKQGFFIEVGCIDGKRFSNTLTFEERGWKGFCIEAHADYIEILKKNRPNSMVCHCAVGEKDEEKVVFFANPRGSLSTLDKSRKSEFKAHGKYFTGFEEQLVTKKSLNTLLCEYNITEIDILSIDIEGYEVEALKGLDLKKYRPNIFVIESDSPEHEHQLDSMLIPNGYTKSFKLRQNIFYLIDPKMEEKVKGRVFNANLVHTRHPLDDEEDINYKIRIRVKVGIIKRLFLSLLNSDNPDISYDAN